MFPTNDNQFTDTAGYQVKPADWVEETKIPDPSATQPPEPARVVCLGWNGGACAVQKGCDR